MVVHNLKWIYTILHLHLSVNKFQIFSHAYMEGMSKTLYSSTTSSNKCWGDSLRILKHFELMIFNSDFTNIWNQLVL